jgi:SAM-dependent methyltransferase
VDPDAHTIALGDVQELAYEKLLLRDVLHPGGLALTRRLGEPLALAPKDRVLDVACGRGASAIHLAGHFSCRVTGLDDGADTIAAAEAAAAESGMAALTSFRQGDAEDLPVDDGACEAVTSECSFCTFLVIPDPAIQLPGHGRRPGVEAQIPMERDGTVEEMAAVAAFSSRTRQPTSSGRPCL